MNLLIFPIKLIKRNIRILTWDNQLQLFRRLEKCSQRLVNYEGAIEFIQICQNFELTPTFVKVENAKAAKWKKFAKKFETSALAEEAKEKTKELQCIRCEMNHIYNEIRQNSSLDTFVSKA